MADLADRTEENADAPKRVKIGNQEVEEHPLPDTIAAADRQAANAAVASSRRGCVFQRFKPPGTT